MSPSDRGRPVPIAPELHTPPGFHVPAAAEGVYPFRGGNLVRPLIDGLAAFRRVCEAVEAARRSVWATVTFMWPEFRMPDGRGSALDVLDRAARRGVDVRLVFWRPDEETARHRRNAFWGAPAHLDALRACHEGVGVRWDRAHPGFCQHQKTWLIDAGGDGATAFVGGINLNPHTLVAPGHDGAEGQHHDVYVELRGPAVADVHHNFAQRWNEASERGAADGVRGARGGEDLLRPVGVPAMAGPSLVRIQRTIHPGRHADDAPPPGAAPSDAAAGERAILAQYLAAIRAARESIYIENQYVETADIVAEIDAALRRGVEVAMLLPAAPDHPPGAYDAPDRRAFFEARAALARFPNFTMAGIAGRTADGRRAPVHVHAKLMVVDDVWATVGSCNLHRFSLTGNAELNASVWCRATAVELRTALLREHLDLDTSAMDGRAALRRFGEVARANRRRLDAGEDGWRGIAFALDPATYGTDTAV